MYMGVARLDPFVVGVRKTCPWSLWLVYVRPVHGTVHLYREQFYVHGCG